MDLLLSVHDPDLYFKAMNALLEADLNDQLDRKRVDESNRRLDELFKERPESDDSHHVPGREQAR